MEENRIVTAAKTEEIMSKETQKIETSSQEIAETEEMNQSEITISTEEAAIIEEKRKMIAAGKTPLAEEVQDDEEFKDLYDEFLAESDSDSEGEGYEMNDPSSGADEYFFRSMGASAVYLCYKKALASGNIEELGNELEDHRPFSGILIIFCVLYTKMDKSKDVMLKILRRYMIGDASMRFDVVGFFKNYDKERTHVGALQRAMFLVMCIFEKAGGIANEPALAKMVVESILDAYDAGIWGDEAFCTIHRFLMCPFATLQVVGLELVTALASICKERNNPGLSSVVHSNKIVEAVHKMDLSKLDIKVVMRAAPCLDALAEMPEPEPEPSGSPSYSD